LCPRIDVKCCTCSAELARELIAQHVCPILCPWSPNGAGTFGGEQTTNPPLLPRACPLKRGLELPRTLKTICPVQCNSVGKPPRLIGKD